MALKAKYRLRASKVDRIAIVDRPAVPDAQILLFKRRSSKPFTPEVLLTKAQNEHEDIAQKSVYGIIDVFEKSFRGAYFDAELNAEAKKSEFENLYKCFNDSLKTLLLGTKELTAKKSFEDYTPDEITAEFRKELSSGGISAAFNLLKKYLGFLVIAGPANEAGYFDIIQKMADGFKENILARTEAFAKCAESLYEVNETEQKAGEDMEKSEWLALFSSLKETVAKVEGELKSLNEKAAAGEARLAALETQNKAMDEHLKAVAGQMEALKPLQEWMKPVEERMGKAEKAVNEITKGFEAIGKRFGLKSSLDLEKGKKEDDDRDVFGDAVRGKKK